MCRFLLFKSKNKTSIYDVLRSFSKMAQKSKAFDGDDQGDGWGISWRENDKWKIHKSINPIWEDGNDFTRFPKSSLFSIHARSASFPQHKNNVEFNQPFISDSYSFVFNGLLKGVSLSLPGEIGAQKIEALVRRYLKTDSSGDSLRKTVSLLKKNSRSIQAVNIGLVLDNTIAAYSFFTKHPAYYSLHYVDNPATKIICSEALPGYDFKTMPNDSLVIL